MKPRLLPRLGHCPGLGRSRGFFLAPLFSVKPNSSKNKLKQTIQLLNFHGKTSFKFLRYQSLTDSCKPRSMLRISINQVKMDKKRLNLTLKHFYWGLGTFYKCNRTKHEMHIKLRNQNMWKIRSYKWYSHKVNEVTKSIIVFECIT